MEFQVTNNTTGQASGIISYLSGDLLINQGDSVSLYYNAPNIPSGTKVHFVVRELNRDLQISPAGADRTNTSGWTNPYLGEALPAGTYHFYAWDEVNNIGSAGVTVIVLLPPKKVVDKVTVSQISGQLYNITVYLSGVYQMYNLRITVDGSTIKQINDDVDVYGFDYTLPIGTHTVCAEVV